MTPIHPVNPANPFDARNQPGEDGSLLGVYKRARRDIWILLVLTFFCSGLWTVGSIFVQVFTGVGRDDTDAATGLRSSLHLRIDQGTGCQYLLPTNVHSAVLVPRLGPDGKQICRNGR